MELKDIEVGQKLKVVSKGIGMAANVGDIVVVSGVTSKYVYVEGNEVHSGSGQSVRRFERYVDTTVTIDFTKPLITRGGLEVTLLSTKGRGDYPVVAYIGANVKPSVFSAKGEYFYNSSNIHDLINTPEKPKQVARYVNVYTEGLSGLHAGCKYDSREEADANADTDRVGCIKFILTEGRYDD